MHSDSQISTSDKQRTNSNVLHLFFLLLVPIFEERPCVNAKICDPVCPNYNHVDLRNQPNLTTVRLEAVFNIQRVDFLPYGKLDFQELYLEVLDDKTKIQSKLNPIKITDEEFNNNVSTKSISNLIMDRTYRPILKVYVSMDRKGSTSSNNNSQIEAFIIKCNGTVSKM